MEIDWVIMWENLEKLFVLLLPIIWYVARAYVRRIDDERLREALTEIVEAAEQIYGSGRGVAKLTYVQETARRRGIKADSAAIESAVFEMDRLWGPKR